MSNVLAKVNGKEITTQDKENLLKSLGPQRAAQFKGEKGDQMLLKELINQELFYFDAKDSDLEETDIFKKEIEKAKENILKQLNIQNTLKDVNVTEEEAKKFFEENQDKFQKGEQVEAKHILVKEEDKIKEIASELNEGLDFSEAAKKYSTCPSKEKGGSLGSFERGKMVPEFEDVAFGLDIDEVSEPVKTQFGYHIIKVTGKSEASENSFEEVKNKIMQQLTVQKQNDLYLSKVEDLKENYDVEILD